MQAAIYGQLQAARKLTSGFNYGGYYNKEVVRAQRAGKDPTRVESQRDDHKSNRREYTVDNGRATITIL